MVHPLRQSIRGVGLIAAAALACLPPVQAGTLRGPFGGSDAVRHDARTRTFDLQHVLVRIDLTGEFGSITGSARLTLEVTRAGIDTVVLDAVEMEIGETTLADGTRLAHHYDGRRLEIELDRAYQVGESVQVEIDYATRPRRGLHFIASDKRYPARSPQVWSQGEPEETRYWIPIYDFPDDKTTTELIITVPKPMTTISNGALVATRPGADRTTIFHWKQEIPHSTYLISLVAGRFDRYTETRAGVSLEYYVPPGTPRATMNRSFAPTPEILEFFADYIGLNYPWAGYSQVAANDFIFGGMENTAATTLTADTLHPASSEPNFASESLVAHELAHQWFGDLVTTRDWPNVWLNEGFATFFTLLWLEQRYGRNEYDYRRFLAAKRYFKEDEEKYRRPIVWDTYVHPLDLFDAHAYQKGALVLTMLRSQLFTKLATTRPPLSVFMLARRSSWKSTKTSSSPLGPLMSPVGVLLNRSAKSCCSRVRFSATR